MSKESLFEKLGIEYQEVYGILYPVLDLPTEECTDCTIVGKYGRMWVAHI